jgi:N-acetylmuramoyl-L-alanine amidase
MPAKTTVLVLLSLGALSFASPGRASPASCDPAAFRVAIDIGHTPEATGALSARGATEYSFNLALAQMIASKLKNAGYSQTATIEARGLGRDQLMARMAEANRLSPDLLLSVHHDDTQKMFHSKWTVAGVERDYSDYATGFSLFVSRKNARFEQSLTFARLLGSAFRDAGMSSSKHHADDVPGERKLLIDTDAGVYAYDNLYVLQHSLAAAVLIEAGVITNRNDELVLGSNKHHQKVAQSVLSAIQRYCEKH